MEKLTYKQAYDKIIDAYFKDEIKPYDNKFCFCGTLSPDDEWRCESKFIPAPEGGICEIRNTGKYPYTIPQYLKMEKALLITIMLLLGFVGDYFKPETTDHEDVDIEFDIIQNKKYEDALFAGMCAALEVLKEIHRGRGEDVDGVQEFKKRVLVK